jgi:hypothetical protein
MTDWLNPARWLLYAGFVAALCLGAWRFEAHIEQKGYDRAQAEYTAAALKASEAARVKEKELQAAVTTVEKRHAETKRRAAADAVAAGNELDLLRSALADRSTGSQDTAAASRIDGPGGLERDLLGACAANLTNLASEADRLESKVVGLQDYVKNVCLK